MNKGDFYFNVREQDMAVYPGKVNAWLRGAPFQRPRINLNLYSLGEVTARIAGDDSSFMTVPIMSFSEDMAPIIRDTLLHDKRLAFLDRMEIEIAELGTLTKNYRTRRVVGILGRLERVHEAVYKQRWTDRVSVEAARLLWLPTREYVNFARSTDDTLVRARQHHEDLNDFVLRQYSQSSA